MQQQQGRVGYKGGRDGLVEGSKRVGAAPREANWHSKQNVK